MIEITRIRSSLFFLSCVFLFWGCSSTSTIQSVTKDGEDLSQYLTYAMSPSSATAVVPGVSPARVVWAQEVVEEELQQRGFRRVPVEEADVYVSVETEITGGREKGGFSIGFGTGSYSRSGGSSVGVSTGPIGAGYIEQSTLTVRLIDPQSEDLLWVGWIDKLEDKKFTELEFREKVKAIMAQLPSR